MSKWYDQYPKGVPQSIDPDNYSSITDFIKISIAKFSTKKAYTNMGVSLTYQEVDQLSDYFASYLTNYCGLKKGDRIAIQIPNVLQFPVVLFAAIKAGLIVVNTNPLYTEREMQHQFKDSGAKAIVILSNFAHLLEKVKSKTDIEHVIVTDIGDMFPAVKRVLVNSVIKYVKKMVPKYSLPNSTNYLQALEKGKQKIFKPVATTLDDVAFLQYTGGTTGVSKGAVLTNRNIIANMNQIFAWMRPILTEGEEIILTPLPLYHIFSLTVNCLAFMGFGAENILITNPRDIPDFIKTMKNYPPTVMTGVNTLYNALVNHKDFGDLDFSKLKMSVAGAMALQDSVAKEWEDCTGTKVIEGYGLTEASPAVCVNPVDGTDRRGSIGLPVPSTEIKLVDDDGKIVADGESGELCVKGPQVMQGYYNRPDETKNVIIDDWLYTGDIATMDADGFFKIVDRKKDMILVSGFNVYPNEIEDVIASHPSVLEVAAVGVPDQKSGEVVKVFIVKRGAVTETEIRDHAKKGLTGYKVPKFVEFREDLPKSNVGKILRRELRQN